VVTDPRLPSGGAGGYATKVAIGGHPGAVGQGRMRSRDDTNAARVADDRARAALVS